MSLKKCIKMYNLLFIIVDVLASTEAFVGTVCLIAVRHSQFRGEHVVVDVGELVRPLNSVHRLVLLLLDMYRLLDPSVHSVAYQLLHLR